MMYSEPDPYRPGYDKNGKKYKRWYERAFAEQAARDKKAHEEEMRKAYEGKKPKVNYQYYNNNNDDSRGGGCLSGCGCLIVLGAVGIGSVFTKSEIKGFMKQVKKEIYVITHLKELKEKARKREKDSLDALKNNKTSSLDFESDKALILCPNHVATLTDDNTLNPQWRLQLA